MSGKPSKADQLIQLGRMINAIVWSLVFLAVIGFVAYALWP